MGDMAVERVQIIDVDTGEVLWQAQDCADYCQMTSPCWRSRVSRGAAPAAVFMLNARTPLWYADEVVAWAAAAKRK